MKKILTFALIAALSLTVLVSCGKKKNENGQDSTAKDTETTAFAETEEDSSVQTEEKKPRETVNVDDIVDEDTDEETEDDTGEAGTSVVGKWTSGDDSIEFTDGGVCKRVDGGAAHEYEYIAEDGRIVFFDGNYPCGDASYTVKGGKLTLTDEGGTTVYKK